MLLNEITTSVDVRIDRINKVLKETYGFTLASEVETGKLNQLYTKIADDLYDLKLDLSSVKKSDYMQKVLIIEGLKLLIARKNEKLREAALVGRGGRALDRVLTKLSDYVRKACDVGDDYEVAIADAMRAYELWPYRFSKDVVEYELRKATPDCDPLAECMGGVDGMFEDATTVVEDHSCSKCDCSPCECDKEKECSKCDCSPCECDKEKVDEFVGALAKGAGAAAKAVGGAAKAAGAVAKGARAAAKGIGSAVKGAANTAIKAGEMYVASKMEEEEPEYKIGGPDDLHHTRGKKIVTTDHLKKSGGEFRGSGQEYTGGPGTTTSSDASDEVKISKMRGMVDFRKWRDFEKGDIMSQVYWLKRQLPPSDSEAFERNWLIVKASLEAKYPLKEEELGENPIAEEEIDEVSVSDRHASREWVRDMALQQAKDAGDDWTVAEPKDDEPDDYFSYQAKKGKKNKMKEGYVKELRKLLEAEVEQAESLIAAKSFSQELQDMVEKLGRLVNEDLPAVSTQMRDSHGSDVASGFEDATATTLNGIMDSLRNAKQELDNSVSSIADGGMPGAVNDMGEFGDEGLGDEEFGEVDDLDVDSDVELDLGDEELGDEFGGADELAGALEEPLGRAKKESIKILGKKIVEAEEKLARIKAQ